MHGPHHHHDHLHHHAHDHGHDHGYGHTHDHGHHHHPPGPGHNGPAGRAVQWQTPHRPGEAGPAPAPLPARLTSRRRRLGFIYQDGPETRRLGFAEARALSDRSDASTLDLTGEVP